MLIEILLLIFLAICIFHWYTRYGRVGKLVETIPGLPAWPLVGSLPSLMVPKENLWLLFRKLNDDYYPIFKFWTTHEVVINLRHPDDIEKILSSMQYLNKSTAYRLLHPWLKTGLLTSTGSKWQMRRKILTPAFHFNVLKSYIDIILENSEKLIETVKNNIMIKKQLILNLSEFSTNYTLNVICETAMGTSLRGVKDVQNKYRDAIRKMGDIIIYRITRPWFRNEAIFSFTNQGREQKEVLKLLHGFSRKVIKERKEYHERTNNHYLSQFETDGTTPRKYRDENGKIFGMRKKRLAMLDLLIAASKTDNKINDEGIQEEVDTFMFEGHDTAAMGLSFILLLLAEHTDVQALARTEVQEVLKQSGGNLGYSEIQQFHYLEMCIKESLRMYPSVPFISRKIAQDLQLNNYVIPGGAIVHIHIYDLHRDPNFWPEPNKFDPNRFSSDAMKNRHPFSYIPFSAGPRNCIGQRFVMMELKATIAHLLCHFSFESIDLAHEVPIMVDLVIRPARPIRMKFIPLSA